MPLSFSQYKFVRPTISWAFLGTFALGATSCSGIELPDPSVPPLPAAPLDPAALLIPSSLLNAELTGDLEPLLKAVRSSMDDVADEALAESSRRAQQTSKDSGSKKTPEGASKDTEKQEQKESGEESSKPSSKAEEKSKGSEQEASKGSEKSPSKSEPGSKEPKGPDPSKSRPDSSEKLQEKQEKGGSEKSGFLSVARPQLAKSAADEIDHEQWREVEERMRVTWRLSRGDTSVKLEGDVLQIEVPFNYGMAVALDNAWGGTRVHACGCAREEWCGGFHGVRNTGVARWSVPLALGSNLRISGEPSFEMEAPGECRLPRPDGRSRIDVKKILLESLSSWGNKGGKSLGATLDSFHGLEDAIRPFWSALHTPSALEEETGPWFKLRPQAMTVTSAQVVGDKVRLPVRVAVRPILSPWPPSKPQIEWPPPTDMGEAAGFRVVARESIDIDTLRARLESKFLQRRYPQRKGYQVDAHFVEISAVELYQSAGVVVVAFVLEGTASGRIAYTGTLHIDPETETLSVVDLELTDESKRSLAMLYDKVERADLRVEQVPWIDGAKLGEEIARAAQWPLAQRVSVLRRKAQLAARSAAAPARQLRFLVEDYQFMSVSMSAQSVEVLVGMMGPADLIPMKGEPVAEATSAGGVLTNQAPQSGR